MRNYRIASIGTSVPPFAVEQETARRLLNEYYGKALRPRTMQVLNQVLSHKSIQKRHIAVDNVPELIALKGEDPDLRVERFTQWATRLAGEAALKAMAKANVEASAVSAIVVNTCTGYICPGISTYLIESLGLPATCRAYDMVGVGCGGAVPNIELAGSLINTQPDGIALSISVEVCSATFQMDNDMSLVVSNAIFGDGAAAAVVWNRDKGLSIVDHGAFYDPACREDVRYVHKNGQLHNRLSPHLPETIGRVVPQQVGNLLRESGLTPKEVAHWALHPGGHKMLEELKQALSLSEQQMEYSRNVLRNYGNMSSPSVLFALDSIMNCGLKPGHFCLMVGYGAGLSVFTSLLKA